MNLGIWINLQTKSWTCMAQVKPGERTEGSTNINTESWWSDQSPLNWERCHKNSLVGPLFFNGQGIVPNPVCSLYQGNSDLFTYKLEHLPHHDGSSCLPRDCPTGLGKGRWDSHQCCRHGCRYYGRNAKKGCCDIFLLTVINTKKT